MHLNPRNCIFSKMMGKSKDIFKWGREGRIEEEEVPQAV